jgi:hypothetical protein
MVDYDGRLEVRASLPPPRKRDLDLPLRGRQPWKFRHQIGLNKYAQVHRRDPTWSFSTKADQQEPVGVNQDITSGGG